MATIVKKELHGGTRWQAFIRRGDVIRKRTFDLKADAERWARGVEREIDLGGGEVDPGGRLPFKDLVDKYEKAGLGREFRVRFWLERFGEKRLSEITPRGIKVALDEYQAAPAEVFVGRGQKRVRAGRLGSQRGPASRNRLRDQLSSIFTWAMDEKLYRQNPVKEVPKVAEPKGRERFLTIEEKDRLLAAARELDATGEWKKLHLLVLMALATGARLSELTEKLRWECIDFQARTAVITDTKNGDSRTLYFLQPVIAELLKHRRKSGLVFSRLDDFEKPFTVGKRWQTALKMAGIEGGFRFHDLRHTAASVMVSSGKTLFEVSKVLGHRSLQSTQRYAHLSVEAQKETVAVLGSWLGSSGKGA